MNPLWLRAIKASQVAGVPPYLAGGAPMPRAVYAPMLAASLATSYVNIVNPGTDDAAPGVAPTWAAGTGWGLAGAQYLTTGIVPAAGWSSLIRFSSVTNTGYIYGCYSGTNTRHYIRPDTTGNQLRYGNGNVVLVTPRLLSGVLGMGGQQGYRDGVADGGAIGAWSGTGTTEIIIGGLLDGTPQLLIMANVQYFIVWDTDVGHATWMPAVSAAVAAL